MPAHIHAALMMKYAEDALENEKPWLLWQRKHDVDGWVPLTVHPAWYESTSYRRKPETIRIGDYDVPEPLRVAPEEVTPFWMPAILGATVNQKKTVPGFWNGSSDCYLWLQNGLVHLTEEAAQLNAEAIISLIKLKT